MAKTAKKLAKRTPATKKAGRYAHLVAHAAMHPNDGESKRHLTHKKWEGYCV